MVWSCSRFKFMFCFFHLTFNQTYFSCYDGLFENRSAVIAFAKECSLNHCVSLGDIYDIISLSLLWMMLWWDFFFSLKLLQDLFALPQDSQKLDYLVHLPQRALEGWISIVHWQPKGLCLRTFSGSGVYLYKLG